MEVGRACSDCGLFEVCLINRGMRFHEGWWADWCGRQRKVRPQVRVQQSQWRSNAQAPRFVTIVEAAALDGRFFVRVGRSRGAACPVLSAPVTPVQQDWRCRCAGILVVGSGRTGGGGGVAAATGGGVSMSGTARNGAGAVWLSGLVRCWDDGCGSRAAQAVNGARQFDIPEDDA